MSTPHSICIKDENGGEQTFIFNQKGEMEETEIKSKFIQIFSASVGSLMCVCFGIMLGWPSPTYPKLLGITSPVPITLDQSALIAGFLMIGNLFATLISTWSYLGTKYGIVIGAFGMLIGWIVMWYATSIYFLLGSRIVIGLSFGYGVGQLKMYIKDMCLPEIAAVLLKLVNFYVFFGVILAFILGYFVTFTKFSMVIVVLTGVVVFVCCLLPHPAKEYLRFGRTKQARFMVKHIQPHANVELEIQKMNLELLTQVEDLSIFQVLKSKQMRKDFAIVVLLTFFQQFTGAPATIVYTQIIFTASKLPFPELLAIAYAVLFFISNFIGVFYCGGFNRKSCLLFSSVSVVAALALNVAVFYYNFNEDYWRYSSLISMFLFIFVHSIGLAVVPTMLIPEYFPERARNVVVKVQIIENSALAIIITKVFQVLYGTYQLFVPFCLFLSTAVVGTFFILVFVPFKPQQVKNVKKSFSL